MQLTLTFFVPTGGLQIELIPCSPAPTSDTSVIFVLYTLYFQTDDKLMFTVRSPKYRKTNNATISDYVTVTSYQELFVIEYQIS